MKENYLNSNMLLNRFNGFLSVDSCAQKHKCQIKNIYKSLGALPINISYFFNFKGNMMYNFV